MNILPNGNIYGFALIRFDEESNSIYIAVMCSHIGIKGAGDILIKEIENISRTLFIEKINLISVDSAVSFYEKYGFTKIDGSCCAMEKYIKNKIGGKRKTNKQRKRRKFKKTRKIGEAQ
jgi:N-acetylglutamate synthase-like GNAT family acetyltransferase